MKDPNQGEQPKEKPSANPVPKADDLSAEEQMERFEEDLKESDWGHQPC